MPITEIGRLKADELGLRAERLDVLENLLQKFIKDDWLQAIAFRAIRRGEVFFEGTYGTNTKPGGVTFDTIFPVASNTKPVIATLLMKLQEDGLLDVNEPVWWYLPEFKGGTKEEICIWHFMTHTSGFDGDFDGQPWGFAEKRIEELYGIKPPEEDAPEEERKEFNKKLAAKLDMTLEEFEKNEDDMWYKLCLEFPMERKPHEKNSYCSFGYDVLKRVVCAVTGESIDDAAKRLLFDPLGMKDSHFKLPREKLPRVLGRKEGAVGYPFINTDGFYLDNDNGGGGLKTTVNDITRYCEMFRQGGVLDGKRYLSKAAIREMMTNHNSGLKDKGHWDPWTLGWEYRGGKMDFLGPFRSHSAISHGGWAGCVLLVDPELDLTAIMYTAEIPTPPQEFSKAARMVSCLISALD